MKAKYWPCTLWGPQAVLSDDSCELLSSVGPIESITFLSSVLKEGWEWWDNLGSELYVFMNSLPIPPLPTKTSRGVKRHPIQQTDVPGPSTSSKRARTTITQANPSQSVLPVSLTPSTLTQTSSARPRKGRRQEPAPLVFPPSLYEGFFSQLANTTK